MILIKRKQNLSRQTDGEPPGHCSMVYLRAHRPYPAAAAAGAFPGAFPILYCKRNQSCYSCVQLGLELHRPTDEKELPVLRLFVVCFPS